MGRLDMNLIDRFVAKAVSKSQKELDKQLVDIAGSATENEVLQLINAGADVNAVSSNGWTPLHHAASRMNFPVFKALLDNGAKLDAVNESGATPVHIAASSGFAIAFLAIGPGPHIDIPDKSGWTPLHYAAATFSHEKTAVLLIGMGAKTGVMDSNGRTPLDLSRNASPHYLESLQKAISLTNSARLKKVWRGSKRSLG